MGIVVGSPPPLYPWSKEQGNGNAQLARKYVSYNDSIRMITYATKPKEVRDRLKREQTTHLGTDLLENEEEDA